MMQIAFKVFLIVNLLFLVGILFILFIHKHKEVAKEQRRGMWIKYVGYLLIVNLFLFTTFLGFPFFFALISVLLFLGLREFFNMIAVKEIRGYKTFGLCAGLGIFGSALFKDVSLLHPSALFALIFALVIPVLRQDPRSSIVHVSSTLLGVFYVSFLLTHLILIYKLKGGANYVVFLYALLVMNDGFSELFGRLLGRRKIWPKISPNKTFAGTIGGFLSALFGSILFRFVLPHFSISSCIMSGAVIGICGQVGDLVASVFKRDSNLKDFGSILPSHGGVLDRFDSLIFTSPLFYYYLIFIA